MSRTTRLRTPSGRSHLHSRVLTLLCILLAFQTRVQSREIHPGSPYVYGDRLLVESNDGGSSECDCAGHPLGVSEDACKKDCTTYCSCTARGCVQESCAAGTLFNVETAECETAGSVVCGYQSQARDDDKPPEEPKETKPPKETKAPKETPAPKDTPAPKNTPSPARVNTPAPLPLSPTAVPVTPAPTPVVVAPTPVVVTPTPVTLAPTPVTVAPTPDTVAPSPVTEAPTPVTEAPTHVATVLPLVPSTAAPVVTTTTPAPIPVTTPLTPSNPVQTPVVSSGPFSANLTAAPVFPVLNFTLSPVVNTSTPSTPVGVSGSSTVVLPPGLNGTPGNVTSALPNKTPPGKSKGGSKTGVIVAAAAATAGVVGLLGVCAAIWCCFRERARGICCGGSKKGSGCLSGQRHVPAGFVPFNAAPPTPEVIRNSQLSSAPSFRPAPPSPGFAVNPRVSSLPKAGYSKIYPFPYRELKQATSNFSEAHLMGEGGFGKVYFGRLDDGVKVAVKRAAPGRKETGEQFRNEVDFLGRVHHKHLVGLVGYCQENGEQMLVYELMAEGSLSSHLYGSGDPLSWQQRMKIALGAARGLEYLHVGAHPAIVHRDVKTDNLLLTSDFDCKVADFGLSRLPSTPGSSLSAKELTSAVKGTLGYLDPDYVTGNPITTKSDVYSFGVVLIQLASGRPAFDLRAGSSSRALVEWARPFLQARNFGPVMDPRLHGHFSQEDFSQYCELALQCVSRDPLRRPSMPSVVRILEVLESAARLADNAPLLDAFRTLGLGGAPRGSPRVSLSGASTETGFGGRLADGYASGRSTSRPSGGFRSYAASSEPYGEESTTGGSTRLPFDVESATGRPNRVSLNMPSTTGRSSRATFDMQSYSGNLGELTISQVLPR